MRSLGHPATRAAVVALLLAGVLVLLYVVALGTGRGLTLDRDAAVELEPATAPRVYEATQALHDTISVVSIAVLGAAVAGLALLRRSPALAASALGLITAANVTTQVLKPLLEALDPTGGDAARGVTGAFPSGHATVAASLAVALVLVAPDGVRPVVAAAGAAYAAAVGVSIVLLGFHYPSDVAGGYLVVAVWASLAVLGLRLRPGRARPAPLGRGVRQASTLVLALALGAVVVVGAALAVSRAPELLSAVEARTTFFLAAAGLTGLAFAVLGGLAAVLGRRGGRPA